MRNNDKKSIIYKMIKQNKLTHSQAEMATLIQDIYRDDSLISKQLDSSQKIYIDTSGNPNEEDRLLNKNRLNNKAIFNEWKRQILSGKIDPLIYHICYSILHHNLSPKTIACEFTEQLYNKSTGSMLKRLELKVSTYKVEKMFKQGLDLFAQILHTH